MTFIEATEIQERLVNNVDNEEKANAYRESWIVTDLEEDAEESRAMAEQMIKDMTVEVIPESDDEFIFVFYLTNGDREERKFTTNDSYTFAPALDKLYAEAPYLCHCKLVME